MIQSAREWLEKDRRYVWHAMSGYPSGASTLVIEQGDGAWITDIEGNRYLDGMSGLWCVNVGYGREELARAAYEQLVKMPFYPLTRGHLPAIELGEKLNEWLAGEYAFFYSNSGSEANEIAFKVARQFHQQNGEPERWKFVSRYRAYHGQTMGALAATGQAQRKYRYEPLAPGFLHVPPPDSYRRPDELDPEAYGRECARDIERLIQWELPETVAAVILEPIITGGGILIPPDNYLPAVKEICERYGVLLIVDEVICGFGRIGTRFGHQSYGIEPDIVTMAKGITSAYSPLSATAVSQRIYEAFAGSGEYERLRHVNTFGGHPASCAVAIRNMQIMEDEELPERSAELGERLLKDLSELGEHPQVGDVRGKGLLVGIELVSEKQSKRPASPQTVAAFVSGCQKRGLIVGKNGDTAAGYNNVVTLAPPLSLTEGDLEFIGETLKRSLEDLPESAEESE
ncbi:Adenosylmethionine-8-amino-7-oxononanoate aminotransferase (plasmid) [Rubrobacter radiotolerans]|uniref:Adenosylmethionine-8-amino-7-oxononanoate aminotransferase n=1 Tax=Rubrobacter radiotolerans TaxID=42256 RepID=A0A023X7S6_RUBRA|nr:aspartate aminotransferase family protein [Rubrobacter radiotolerans]AHY48104.1 Adenosylmethionine-8-amino-7-oxononanoate aminotransferase [Rubrobacter radiotolerans]MDX5895378.1 aspartate aminotransferase family protein [Rubrobacter radiotolerans]SMC01728.1 Adenosylmethionine-8-amino-7-oxononanoate aminotransferase [Rubrobacter radiotolerans DSM 5868]